MTIDLDFEAVEEYNSTTGKSIILIRYNESGTYTSDVLTNKLTMLVDTGELDSGLSIDWVIETSNLGLGGQTTNTTVTTTTDPIFTVPYNTATLTTSAGSGGGDPHICPLFNSPPGPETLFVSITPTPLWKFRQLNGLSMMEPF